MVTAWRIVKSRYASSAFDGEGARANGGRWNSVGVRVAYGSGSVALATLEVLVGLQKTGVLSSYSLASAQFDEGSVEVVSPESLPDNWRRYPAPPETQTIGDRWVREQRSLALRVPSAIIAAESNYLLNPAHPGFASVAISTPVAFAFDERLVASLRKV
jgi:RES domain-containing protein